MKISLGRERHEGYLIYAETGETILIQSDYDFPSVAAMFGWPGENTNEPISRQIASATAYLDDCADFGKEIEDPGYFDSEAETER